MIKRNGNGMDFFYNSGDTNGGSGGQSPPRLASEGLGFES